MAKHRAPAPRLRARLTLGAVVAIAAMIPTLAGSAAQAATPVASVSSATVSSATVTVIVNIPMPQGHYWGM